MYKTQNKIKNDLNRAVHAASLSIDKQQLAKGFIKLDTITPGRRAQDMFYRYLRLNMDLDNSNKALPSSILSEGQEVTIHELIYVDLEEGSITNLESTPSSCTYIYSPPISRVSCSITLNEGTSTQITRTVDQTLIGPSVVAIISAQHEGVGMLNDEPYLIPAVQEVIFRKR